MLHFFTHISCIFLHYQFIIKLWVEVICTQLFCCLTKFGFCINLVPLQIFQTYARISSPPNRAIIVSIINNIIPQHVSCDVHCEETESLYECLAHTKLHVVKILVPTVDRSLHTQQNAIGQYIVALLNVMVKPLLITPD